MDAKGDNRAAQYAQQGATSRRARWYELTALEPNLNDLAQYQIVILSSCDVRFLLWKGSKESRFGRFVACDGHHRAGVH